MPRGALTGPLLTGLVYNSNQEKDMAYNRDLCDELDMNERRWRRGKETRPIFDDHESEGDGSDKYGRTKRKRIQPAHKTIDWFNE